MKKLGKALYKDSQENDFDCGNLVDVYYLIPGTHGDWDEDIGWNWRTLTAVDPSSEEF